MPQSAPSEDRNEAAEYIASMSASLASMARQHGLDTLGYLLDMAKLEAETVTRKNGGNGRPS